MRAVYFCKHSIILVRLRKQGYGVLKAGSGRQDNWKWSSSGLGHRGRGHIIFLFWGTVIRTACLVFNTDNITIMILLSARVDFVPIPSDHDYATLEAHYNHRLYI